MPKSLIYLHCKMQSRIRKAGVRQGLGENKLGLLSMTMPIRVTLWSLMLLCENLGSHTHEGNLPVLLSHCSPPATAPNFPGEEGQNVIKSVEWPRVWAHCWVTSATDTWGSHKEQPPSPSREKQGKCPGLDHEQFCYVSLLSHACFIAKVGWSSPKTYKWKGEQDQTEKQH